MSHEEMAIALGISRPTLEKHFERELSIGSLQRRVEVLQAMHRAAMKGNVAAQKAYIAATPQASAPPLPPDPKPDASGETQGKKAQAHEAAKTAQAGTSWEDVLPKGPAARLQ